jgi:hypothetical protein
MLGQLVCHPLLEVSGAGAELRQALDDIPHEVKAIKIV